MLKLVLIGSGGHSISVIDIISRIQNIKIVGYVDKTFKNNFDLKYLGNDNDLNKIFKTTNNAHIAIGHIKSNKTRKNLFKKLKSIGFRFPVIKSTSSIISKKSIIEEGVIVMENTIINSGTSIGYNSIINNKALIEHGSTIGNNCHISTGVLINGDIKIGNNVFIGSGTIIHNSIKIGNNCFINSGKIITKNLLNNEIIK